MNYIQILEKTPEELRDWCISEFQINVEIDIYDSQFGMKAGELLIKLGNQYSYLQTLLTYAERNYRVAKRTQPKDIQEDFMDKRDILRHFSDSVKQLYAAVSRAGTLKLEQNKELMMLKET